MDEFNDTQDLFAGLQPLALPIDPGQSDSEDEIGLSSLADHDNYAYMNIPESMKNILRMNPDGKDMDSTQDDSESDNDSIYKTPSVDIDRLNADITKNKFVNFPLMPPKENEPEAKKKKTKKPKGKKKRRDKGKKNVELMDEEPRNKNLDDLLAKFAGEQDSDEDTPKKKKSKGRKTRKTDGSMANKVDENGERLVRTTEFLDTDSDNSSEDEKALSKKQELEMYKESERLRRAADARLKPSRNVVPYNNFVSIQRERDTMLSKQPKTSSQQTAQLPLNQNKQDDTSDDDLIILDNPMASIMSPDHVRNPTSSWSPVKHSNKAIRTYNKSLLAKITNQGFSYRMKMEQEAKARGQFSSATERANKLLEKEKNAKMINDQIKMHFEINTQNKDDEEVDEDYRDSDDDEEEEIDYLNQLSGQDEDEEEDTSAKRKMDDQESEEDEERDDMGPLAMNRWMSKKVKKSIFDDSDDDEEVEKKKKVISAPAPAHSISNFFKTKEDAKAAEHVEEKSLSRLKRRDIQENVNTEGEDMDIDEPEVIPKVHKPRREYEPTGPKEKSEYFEEEAEEEDDEFFGAGGEDIDNGENLDEFEEDDLLVHENDEHIDEAALRDAYNKQDAESDSHLIQRLLKDVTGGGLRKQKAAAEAGLVLDDIDLYDEEDNDLIAVRLAAAARRRKLLRKKGADPLDNLMNDPKTAAFAKASQAIPDDTVAALLSESEGEGEEEQVSVSDSVRVKLVIEEDDEEEDKDDLMDVSSDEDDQVVVDEFNPMSSPFRGGIVNNMTITSADDDDEEFQVENMKSIHSPLNNHRTKSIFSSPVALNRFNRLMSETNNNTSDSPRVGFGTSAAPKPPKPDEEEIPKTFGSIGGFLKHGGDGPKKSRLGSLLKKPDVFKYVEQ